MAHKHANAAHHEVMRAHRALTRADYAYRKAPSVQTHSLLAEAHHLYSQAQHATRHTRALVDHIDKIEALACLAGYVAGVHQDHKMAHHCAKLIGIPPVRRS